jgi:hypothetical protein
LPVSGFTLRANRRAEALPYARAALDNFRQAGQSAAEEAQAERLVAQIAARNQHHAS